MTIKHISAILALCLAFNSCKKKSSDEPQPATVNTTSNTTTSVTYGKVQIHLHTWVGTDRNYELQDANENNFAGEERKISLGIGKVYLSNFQLVKMDGSLYPLADTLILWEHPLPTYTIGKAPVGKYKAVRFKVGFDSTMSKKPVETAFGGILNQPAMWFESSANPEKYVFAHFKGKLDTASVPDPANAKVNYEFKIGTKQHLIQVSMKDFDPGSEFNLIPNGEVLHMYVNLERLFDGIDLSNLANLNVKTLDDNSSALSEKIASNIQRMFYYE